MAIDGLEGEKSASERFPGALHTYTYESMMSNGWALQSCTSHLLSQDFMREFEVSYQDKEGKQAHPYYTSWGASTRLLGALISSHSDNRGLVIPPKMSEYVATLLPLYANDEAGVREYTDTIAETLLGKNNDIPVQGQYFRARINTKNQKLLLDARDVRLGEKINDWELSGYPIRIEYGPRDMAQSQVVVADRILGEKHITPISDLKKMTETLLEKGQEALLEKSRNRLQKIQLYATMKQISQQLLKLGNLHSMHGMVTRNSKHISKQPTRRQHAVCHLQDSLRMSSCLKSKKGK